MALKTLTLQPTDLMRLMQSPWMQRAIRIINLLLVIWIAALLATLTWSLLDKPESESQKALSTEPPAVDPQIDPHRLLVRQMPKWHLMGKAVVETPAPAAKPSVPIDAPETRLKLVLRGAFASDDPQFARAIIADPRGKEETYAVGEVLPGDAELREIHPEKVLLMRGGRYETLHLPRDDKATPGRSATRSRTARVSQSSAQSPSQRLQSIRQSLQKNPKSLYGLVRTTPKKDDTGKMVGYILEPGRDPQLFEQMGLQPGDVVTQINDIALDNLSNGMRALKSAQSGDSVTMTVLRGEQEETLSFSLPE